MAAGNVYIGICSTVIAGLLYNIFIIELETLAEWGWPQFQMLSLMYGTISVCLGIAMIWSREPVPTKSSVLTGFFFALNRALATLAIELGTPLGDFSSLNSASSVFACLLGWVCLREPLTMSRVASVTTCFAGAFLVARPQFVFGHRGPIQTTSDTLWLGHVMSVMSGCSVAGFFISLRWVKSSSMTLSLFFAMQIQGFVVTSAFVCIRGGPFLIRAVSAPLECLGGLALIVTTSFTFAVLYSFAGKLCSAAVNSVVDITVRIVTGFLSQWFLLGTSLHPITVGGGALMLIGAILIPIESAADFFASRDDVTTSTRNVDPGVGSACSMQVVSVPNVAEDIAADRRGADDDKESLSSFIVSELTSVGDQKTWECPRRRLPRNDGIGDVVSVAGRHVVFGAPVACT
eukprot:TRINITY_DN48457_c0_g1_i1.p1 TRINITY_DN48457_c0_g1~~TRINITY_DN48457_c0_g1_i1.p1  ORF type:complete len:404 (-),score=36.00 TRINITY_DN48457_c0_g1_i1:95-1306(-)